MALAACTSESDESVVELGVLYVQGETFIQAPDTAVIDQQISISVESWGDSCYTAESTPVLLNDPGATITVFDRRITHFANDDEACLANLMPIQHHATLAFSTIGVKTVTVHGWDSGHTEVDVPVEVSVQ